jgi:hypothetical protein
MNRLLNFTQFVNEHLSNSALADLEEYADDLFQKLGIDVVFTRHFKERVNDIRNGKPIKYEELEDLFSDAYRRAGKYISNLPAETEAVLRDIRSNLNSPFIIQDSPDASGEIDHDMIMKTIMRKERFMSNNQTIPVY